MEDFVTKDVIKEAVRLSDGTPYQDIVSDLVVMAYVMALRRAEAAGPTAIRLSQLTIIDNWVDESGAKRGAPTDVFDLRGTGLFSFYSRVISLARRIIGWGLDAEDTPISMCIENAASVDCCCWESGQEPHPWSA